MELLIVLLILAVMLLIFGVPLQILLIGAALLIALLLAVMTLFFVATAISLLFFKRRRGHFLRFEKSDRFEQAIYLVDGEEYRNLFPAETILRQKIYSERERTVLVRRSKRRLSAFDMHSVLILALGLIGSAASMVLFVAVLLLFV